MEVCQNDQLVLRTVFDAPDSEPPAKLWRRAGQEPSHSEEEVLRVQPDPGDPLHATLKGTIHIKILHTTNPQTTASLTDLKLVRRAADTSKWFLPESEVERAARAMQPVVTSKVAVLGLPTFSLVAGLVIHRDCSVHLWHLPLAEGRRQGCHHCIRAAPVFVRRCRLLCAADSLER